MHRVNGGFMSTPLFSIIVPIYNIERYIEQCILSILDQTFTNFEVILVNDGSPDGCPQICDEYAIRDSRIKVVHKKNGGIVSARQAGVDEAKGEYIACVDGDDWISKDYLEKFAEVINQYASDVVCCGAILAYEDKETRKPLRINLGYYDRNRIENEIFPILIERDDGVYFPPSLWGKVFRREIYQQQQLVSTFVNIGEDHACTKPCIYHSQSMYIMEYCLYYYRQNPQSMTKNKKVFDWNGPRIIGKHFEKQIPMGEADFQEQVYRSVVHNLFNVCVSQFNRKEVYSVVIKDIKLHISEVYYDKAIKNCKYKIFTKGWWARLALEKKFLLAMMLYNKIAK
jgi:glycosyltransferase involved in cell wall biosynthesis